MSLCPVKQSFFFKQTWQLRALCLLILRNFLNPTNYQGHSPVFMYTSNHYPKSQQLQRGIVKF